MAVAEKPTRRTFGKGLIRDTPDAQDFPHQKFERCMVANVGALPPLPPVIDLRSAMSPVRDQGNLGACTGFALCALREALEIQEAQRKMPVALTATFGAPPVPPTILSPLFLYYEERARENDIGQDAGAQIRTGLQVLKAVGVAPESADVYDPTKFTQAPDPAAVTAAADFTISAYYRIFTLRQLRRTLAYGHPAVLGIAVYESFEGDECIKTGIVPMPEAGEQLMGGHAILACGYDDAHEQILLKNSWGADVGDAGYFRLPYAYFDPQATGGDSYVFDIWTAITVATGP